MSKQGQQPVQLGRWPPKRVTYVDGPDGEEAVEHPMSRAEAAGLRHDRCGHALTSHLSPNGWPGPYICRAPGCECVEHGEDLRWEGIAQAPNLVAERNAGSGAYIG